MRKQVSNYKKESEELQIQADALKEEIATLADKQENAENGESGPSRRTTMNDGDETMEDASRHAESSEESNRKLEGTIQQYEIVKERLEKDHRHLLEQVDDLEEQLNQSKKEKKAIQKQWAAEREQLEMSLKTQWEEDRKTLLAEREELVNRGT